jgi:hypothetical protein
LTATELMGRPTYVEEFQNIRDNVNKAVMNKEVANSLVKGMTGTDDDCDNISHYSKISMRRKSSRAN